MRGFAPALIGLLLVATALAGCAASDDPEPQSDDVQIPAETEELSNETAPEEAAEPVESEGNATEEAVVDPQPPVIGEFVASVMEAEVPFDVTFNFSAEHPDGKDLSWTLDVTGDGEPETEGTVLPANYTYTYTEVGNYTVTFTVSDGEKTVNETLVVVATEAVSKVLQEVEASWSAGEPSGCAGLAPNPYHPANAALHGITMYIADVDEATWGHEFVADFEIEAHHLGVYLHFSSQDAIVVDSFSGDDASLTGTVPETATKVTLRVCGAAGASALYQVVG